MDEDIQRALALEQTFVKKEENVPVVMLRFPDPELGIDLVKSYSPDIDTVHFVHSFAPRYCFLYLKPNTNVQDTVENLSKIPFGNGFLTAEYKPPLETSPCTEDVDPNTLYVGNLPKGMPTKKLKQLFPGAKRVDVGFAQRMRNTRFAFVTYATVEAAIEAFQKLVNSEMDSRTLIVRFKRKRHKDAAEDNSRSAEPLSTSSTVAHLSVKRQKFGVVDPFPTIAATRIKEEIVEEELPNAETTSVDIAQSQEEEEFLPAPIKTESEETDYFNMISEKTPVVPLLLLPDQNNSSTGSSGRSHASTNAANKKSDQNSSSSFLQKLHEDVRRAKFTEDTPKVRDELDDLFAKMNSDNEDDGDGFG